MGLVPAREALEAMKRVDIQKLCKVCPPIRFSSLEIDAMPPLQDYGVKANLKTEALIDLLLDASR